MRKGLRTSCFYRKNPSGVVRGDGSVKPLQKRPKKFQAEDAPLFDASLSAAEAKKQRAENQVKQQPTRKRKRKKKKHATTKILDGGTYVCIGNQIIPKNWPNFDSLVAFLTQ